MTTREIIIISVFLVIFILFGVLFFNKINNMSDKFDNYENTINALNDSIHVSINNGITEYAKKTPEIYLDEFINSEIFKTLSDDQKQFYNDINKIKGLISATNAQLQKQGTDLATLKNNQNSGVINNDTISYKLGTVLEFEQIDTTKALKWNGVLTLNKTPQFKLTYNYKFNIQTSYERQKDKSIVVKYQIDDPELQVNEMFNYTIPTETKTKFGRWIDKNKKVFEITTGSVLFLGGGYIGYNLAK